MTWSRVARYLILGGGLGFLYVPIAIVVLYAFNDSRLVTVWTHFSLRWFATALQNDQLMGAARLSFMIATGSATIATTLGTLTALRGRVGSRRKVGKALDGLLLSPIVLPDVLIGFGLLLFFVVLGQMIGFPRDRGLITLFLAHIALGAPYSFVVVRARLAHHAWKYEEAAADLGAGPIRTLWTITLPLLVPTLMSAWLAAFIISFDDVVVASFVSGPGGSTLPMVILSSVRLGLSPQANAVAAMLLVAVLVIGSIVMATASARNSLLSSVKSGA